MTSPLSSFLNASNINCDQQVIMIVSDNAKTHHKPSRDLAMKTKTPACCWEEILLQKQKKTEPCRWNSLSKHASDSALLPPPRRELRFVETEEYRINRQTSQAEMCDTKIGPILLNRSLFVRDLKSSTCHRSRSLKNISPPRIPDRSKETAAPIA